MPYHTMAEWQNLLMEAQQAPVDWVTEQRWFHHILCDFETLGYPDDTQWQDPLSQVFKNWVQVYQLEFSHFWLLNLANIQDGDHYQRIGDLAARLSEKLALPKLHPGYAPIVNFESSRTVELQVVQRLAPWQNPEQHRTWLREHASGWAVHATKFGVATAWPVFLHFLQWGVEPPIVTSNALQLLAAYTLTDAQANWYNLAAEPTFVTWCFLRRAAKQAISARSWRNWVYTLPPDHAAYTLAAHRAAQAYDLWATLQAPGQPPNWLSLLQMLEPALDQAPTGDSPVGDLTL